MDWMLLSPENSTYGFYMPTTENRYTLYSIWQALSHSLGGEDVKDWVGGSGVMDGSSRW